MEGRKPRQTVSDLKLINSIKGCRFYYIEEQEFVFIQLDGVQDDDIKLAPGIFAGIDEDGQIVSLEIYTSRN